MTYAIGNTVSSYHGTMETLIQKLETDIKTRSTVGQSKTLNLLRSSNKKEFTEHNIKNFLSVVSKSMDCQSIHQQKLNLAHCCMKDRDAALFVKGLIETINEPQVWELNFSENWIKMKKPFLVETAKGRALEKFKFLTIDFSGNKILDDPNHFEDILSLVKRNMNLSVKFSKDSKDSSASQAIKQDIKDHSNKNFIYKNLRHKIDNLNLKISSIAHFNFQKILLNGTRLNDFLEPYSNLMKVYANFEEYTHLFSARELEDIQLKVNTIKAKMEKIEGLLTEVDRQRERQ